MTNANWYNSSTRVDFPMKIRTFSPCVTKRTKSRRFVYCEKIIGKKVRRESFFFLFFSRGVAVGVEERDNRKKLYVDIGSDH